MSAISLGTRRKIVECRVEAMKPFRKLNECQVDLLHSTIARYGWSFPEFRKKLKSWLAERGECYQQEKDDISIAQKWFSRSPQSRTAIPESVVRLVESMLSIDLGSASDLSPALPEPLPLPTHLPSNAVLLVDPNELSEGHRAAYLAAYKRLVPSRSDMALFSASTSTQSSFQRERPIDLGLLATLLPKQTLGRKLSFPFSSNELAKIGRAVELTLSKRSKSGKFSPSFKSSISSIYDYLSVQTRSVDPLEQASLDVIVIAGARWSFQVRCDLALQIASKSESLTLIPCGGSPSYDSQGSIPISEADAMAVYIRSRSDMLRGNIHVIVERRPSTLLEAAACLVRRMQTLSHQECRPIRIGLLTSPYGMRRMLWTYESVFGRFCADAVERIRPLPCATTIDRGALFLPLESGGKLRFGYEVYVRELFKLISGRAAGEF